MLFLGLDLGTQGVRVVLADPDGRVAGSASLPLPIRSIDEQQADGWWATCRQAIGEAISKLQPPHRPEAIAAVAVDGTSGTILPVDGAGEPLGDPIMYCDRRAQAEAEAVSAAGARFIEKVGYQFNAAFGLPKILWIKNHEPKRFNTAARFIHPTDFLNGKLCGRFGTTDWTNALKTGFDVVDGGWPSFIEKTLGIPHAKLPEVVAPGEPLGQITAAAAEQTGLPKGTPVIAGMTDGTASFVSSGAVREGDFSSTLGTTLVVKGTTRQRIASPSGALYCGRHPGGKQFWLPGGGSFVGGAYIRREFEAADLGALEAAAASRLPTGIALYPLAAEGERFPFIHPTASAFATPAPPDEPAHFAAAMEGVAYVERWIYEQIESLGAPVGEAITTSGGGCRNRLWLQIRADVTGRQMRVPAVAEAAHGSAILAAAASHYDDLQTACERMVSIVQTVEPSPAMARRYTPLYARFRSACSSRSYR